MKLGSARESTLGRPVGSRVFSRGRSRERFAGPATCQIRFGELPTPTEPTMILEG